MQWLYVVLAEQWYVGKFGTSVRNVRCSVYDLIALRLALLSIWGQVGMFVSL